MSHSKQKLQLNVSVILIFMLFKYFLMYELFFVTYINLFYSVNLRYLPSSKKVDVIGHKHYLQTLHTQNMNWYFIIDSLAPVSLNLRSFIQVILLSFFYFYLFIDHSFIHSFIHSFVRSFVCSFVRCIIISFNFVLLFLSSSV